MTAEGGTPGWAEAAVAFIAANLPLEAEGEWRDYAMSGFEIGCDALAAMGHARRTISGAERVTSPALPKVLPRWDDIAVAVLKVAQLAHVLQWRRMDGTPEPQKGRLMIRIIGAPPPPPPNIAAGPGSGPALATPVVQEVLEALGLVVEGRWTAGAETVLWRDMPREWGLDLMQDPRFQAAVERAVASVPEAIRVQMSAKVQITEDDVAEDIARSHAAVAEAQRQYGPGASIGGVPTQDQARRGLIVRRRNDLDWLFFRHWRLADGWLEQAEASRALEISYDDLAIAMRKAVMARLYPESPVT